MAFSYIATTNLNNAARGILSLYLMHLMGPTATGTLAANMAPLIFVSMLVTAFSAECFIRGSRYRISGYRDRVASLLIDTLYMTGSIAYVLTRHSSFLETRNDVLLGCILIAAAYGQISLNNLLDRKAWPYLAAANTGEVVLHAALLATWFRDDPAGQFIMLAFSRWLFLNVLNAVYILLEGGFSLRSTRRRVVSYLARLRWILRATRLAHLGNLGLKTLWTTLDVYLINMYWTATEAGNYRFVKSLGGLPALIIAPLWTVQRAKILADWNHGPETGIKRFNTILRLSLRFTLPMPAVVLLIYVLYEHLGGAAASLYHLTAAAMTGFSMWWLTVSLFGWVRYVTVALARFAEGNAQNLLIICLALLLVPLREFIDPQVAFPAVICMSNFVFVYCLLRNNA